MGSISNDPRSKLSDVLVSLEANPPQDDEAREQMLLDARKLILALEKPHNVIDRVCFGIWETISLHVGMDMGILRLLEQHSPRTTDDIVNATKGDPVLTRRIIRSLAAHGSINENEDGSFSSTTVSSTFSTPDGEAAMRALYGFMTPGWLATPEYLREINYKNPSSGTNTAFTKAYGKPEGTTFWEIIKGSPYMADLNKYMSTYNEGHQSWIDIYPVAERILRGEETDPQGVVMVDAGGGHGHQAADFKKRFPEAQGRVVVQDLPHGIPKIKPEGVEFMAHNLMDEQPIKGARFYYFRYVIHNWPSDTCAQMLTQIRKAMKPGYSKVLINEWIMPERGASKFMTAADLNMMSLGGSAERTLELHREYLTKAGLKISGVWKPKDNISECVIEAEVA